MRDYTIKSFKINTIVVIVRNKYFTKKAPYKYTVLSCKIFYKLFCFLLSKFFSQIFD